MLGLKRTLLFFPTVEASTLKNLPCRLSACSFSSTDGWYAQKDLQANYPLHASLPDPLTYARHAIEYPVVYGKGEVPWEGMSFFALYLREFLRETGLFTCDTSPSYQGAEKKTNLFFEDGVQSLLKKLTRKDMNKVFRKKKDGKAVKDTVFKFMTTAQLVEAVRDAERKADKLLQMPPVMSERKEIDHILVKDEKLVGLLKSKFVFTDISLGKTDRNRAIAVRDEEGTLRLASWEERARMNQTYFPRPARELWVPVMFQDENLLPLLEKKEWEFVLDRACAQFEPDDPDYIRVTRKVFEFVNSAGDFNSLRSTRHYGPLVFHLAQSNNLDSLLVENLETDRLEDACWAIQLYKILHPDAKVDSSFNQGSELDYVKVFIDNCSNEKAKLELAYKNFKHYLSSPRSAAAV